MLIYYSPYLIRIAKIFNSQCRAYLLAVRRMSLCDFHFPRTVFEPTLQIVLINLTVVANINQNDFFFGDNHG